MIFEAFLELGCIIGVIPKNDIRQAKLAKETLNASPHCFSSLLTVTDSSHILFGTDYIFATEAAVPATIAGLRNYDAFTDADLRAIEHENTRNLFPTLR